MGRVSVPESACRRHAKAAFVQQTPSICLSEILSRCSSVSHALEHYSYAASLDALQQRHYCADLAGVKTGQE